MGFKLSNIDFVHGLCLAPMAGYTDHAMRSICRECGAEYTVTEMVSAKALTYGDKKTFPLAKIYPSDTPCAVQIFGSEPDVMARASELLLEHSEIRPVAIDINMGCPVNKIFSNGDGSALMRSPELIGKIVSAVVHATDIPVTVKLRSGIDIEHINAVECALAAEDAGASLVCIHGRTRVQMYGGSADREIIKNVKSSLHIPVIANGDILTGEDAVAMLRDTGADGIAVGRGAVGNPFLFSEIRAALEGEKYREPSLALRIDTALRQLSVAIAEKGESCAVTESRKQIALYLRSFHGAARIRAEINRAETYDDVRRALLLSLGE